VWACGHVPLQGGTFQQGSSKSFCGRDNTRRAAHRRRYLAPTQAAAFAAWTRVKVKGAGRPGIVTPEGDLLKPDGEIVTGGGRTPSHMQPFLLSTSYRLPSSSPQGGSQAAGPSRAAAAAAQVPGLQASIAALREQVTAHQQSSELLRAEEEVEAASRHVSQLAEQRQRAGTEAAKLVRELKKVRDGAARVGRQVQAVSARLEAALHELGRVR